ncbi:MAG: DUF3078 domain-containing protein [Cytophagales bacterium]|nr:DUF3078 domain-containing protein [Cytophagales bacterium]
MKILLSFCFAIFVLCTQAQTPTDTSYWHKYLEVGATGNQSSFSDNWKGGGVASLGLNFLANGRLDYMKDKITWINIMNLLYGTTKLAEKDFRKSADLVFLDTKLGYKLSGPWSIFTSVNFQTQFDVGNKYTPSKLNAKEDSVILISKFFAPVYLTEAAGVEYKPVPYFFIRLSPIATRQIFIGDLSITPTKADGSRYGVPAGEKFVNQVGFQIMSQLDKDLYKNINFKARYFGFGEYEKIGENSIVSRLDIFFTAKITKYITANANFTVVYDKTSNIYTDANGVQSTRDFQTAQTIGIGILYLVGKK